MLGRIDMPHIVGFCFGTPAVIWAGYLCLLGKIVCSTVGDIIGDANSLTLGGEVIWFAVCPNLALLLARDRFQPHSYIQVESWACSKNRFDQVVGGCCRGRSIPYHPLVPQGDNNIFQISS